MQSYDTYEKMKKSFTGFQNAKTGKDFLEFQRDIIMLVDILDTYQDEERCVIKEVSIAHLKQLRTNVVDKYTNEPFRNDKMKKWHAHLGRLLKNFTSTMRDDQKRPSWIKLMKQEDMAGHASSTEKVEDNSWMEMSTSEEETENEKTTPKKKRKGSPPALDQDQDYECNEDGTPLTDILPELKTKQKQKKTAKPAKVPKRTRPKRTKAATDDE